MEIKCEIVEELGTIADLGNGNTIELNVISWNGKTPVYDLRRWFLVDGVKKAQKGLTFTESQFEVLKDVILNKMLS